MKLRITLAATAAAVALAGAGCGDDDETGAPSGASGSAATSQAEAEAPAAAPQTVTPEAIAPRAASGEVLLVDVREDEEWDAGHAPDAVHVPLATVADRLDEITEQADGRPVAFICRSGNRSAQAAQIAVDGGVQDVINVGGGMGAWASAGLPIEPEGGSIL